ncbi:galactose-1-phosphate uridylyltransferase [uncultured Brachyspira sp.]|uniref:galactose-1-phosphate uridylyltransferase n=1 Tax=uncultured Brachyspira sp. TaxID=221953 RepID=UPI00262FA6A2|nr:galactose-1-phosphate uridylyltransferase [uncultured Brachyspira sp.]
MPHIRKDPVTKQSVIISAERTGRPSDYVNINQRHIENSELSCPFCRGHEMKTPDSVYTVYAEQEEIWQVRIVPNKYPIISETHENELPKENSLFCASSSKGFHDVIIEHPNHYFNFYHAEAEDFFYIFKAVIKRLKDLGKNKDMLYSLYFKNFGPEAGASLSHSHSQIITTPFIPMQMLDEINGSLEYYNEKNRCVYCDIIDEEKRLNDRVICENDNFIAVCPFASRSPYQIYIMPKQHSASIVNVSSMNILDFADILKNIFDRLYKVLGEVSFNYVLHTLLSALEVKFKYSSHWFLDIMPKMSKLAGYELGSGVFINSITPEDAAEQLRNAL